jgi:hypothetical protein
MTPTVKGYSKWWIYPVAGFVLLAVACNSRHSRRESEERPAAQAVNANDPGFDLNCIIDRIQNPPEAFHYSYKKDTADDQLDEEADLNPQTMDGTAKDKYGSRTFHGVHSDPANWQAAWQNLTAIAGASSAFALVHSSSATVREGSEKMNGYDTIRYSIDTARGSAVENGLYRATLGAGGFEKGTIWVTSQGCPVKFSLDSELHLNNGNVEKIHYEEEMIRK